MGDTVQCRISQVLAGNCDAAGDESALCGCSPAALQVPAQVAGNTLTDGSTIHSAAGCVSTGAATRDVVYTFEAPIGAVYAVTISNSAGPGILYPVSGCAGGVTGCDDVVTVSAGVPALMPLSANAGETVTFVVDGAAEELGAYELTLDYFAPTCAAYCDRVMAACVGPDAQYQSEEACLSWCGTTAAWAAGTTADTSGNTVGCRMHQAGLALGGVAAACEAAGRDGGDVCGTRCQSFCALDVTLCPSNYTGVSDCLTACGGLVSAFEYDDDVECRFDALVAKGSSGCVDSGMVSPVCADLLPRCESYCTAITAYCTGVNAQYGSYSECMATCTEAPKIPLGDYTASTTQAENTVACRLHSARLSYFTDQGLRCEFAGLSGGNHCGTLCQNYCFLQSKGCDGGGYAYSGNPDDVQCLTECNGWSQQGAPGDTASDTAYCRTTWMTDGDCFNGGPTGGVQCTESSGEGCGAPRVIGSLPHQATVQAPQSDLIFGQCDFMRGAHTREGVWSFTPQSAGQYTVTIATAGTVYDLYILDDCANPSSCSAQKTSPASKELTFNGAVGQKAFIVVETHDSGYTLTLNGPF